MNAESASNAGFEVREWDVPEGLDGDRVDSAIARLTGLSRSKATALIEAACVWLDEQVPAKSARVVAGARLRLHIPNAGSAHESVHTSTSDAGSDGCEVNATVLFEDDDIIVLDKPVGMAAHASPGWVGPTVTSWLTRHGYSRAQVGAAEREGIVHRLDVGTSGVMIVARSAVAYSELKSQFKERTVEKIYHTVVQGHPDPASGTIDAPIDRHPTADYRFAVVSGGKPSITHYDTLEMFRYATLLGIHLETGRTHQIRVHMSAIRHPCVGDTAYGADPALAARLGLSRQWLHAVRLEVTHPRTKQRVEFASAYPEDLQHALDLLRDWTNG
ncbi:MAG: RluA family pseudouridine synthase [Actinobacteria bacterium]|nr:RluA family pseudouridine synthase [Actinomycetota bacterium]